MELREHEGKALLATSGIAIPRGRLAASPGEAIAAARDLGYPVMLKAQTPGGGRGRIAGVSRVLDEEATRREAERLLQFPTPRRGHAVVLVEECIPGDVELYVSYLFDYSSAELWLLFSPRGGVDVEAVPPGDVMRIAVSWRKGPDLGALRCFASSHGPVGMDAAICEIAASLHACVRRNDLLLAEVNPLRGTKGGGLVAVDARVVVDDDALFRHEGLREAGTWDRDGDAREAAAGQLGASGLVELDGDIAVVANGAGLGMASMDLLQAVGLRPAGFLDTGGGLTAELIRGALDLLLARAGLRGVLVNLYGGINSMVEAARGVTAALSERRTEIPVVVKLCGNEQEEGWAILEEAGVTTVRSIETEVAVEQLAALLGGTS